MAKSERGKLMSVKNKIGDGMLLAIVIVVVIDRFMDSLLGGFVFLGTLIFITVALYLALED